MDYRRIEEIYDEQFIDRDWWGNFPATRNLLDRNLGTTDLLKLIPVCVRIAFHVTGEIPKMVLSNRVPSLSMNPKHIALNLKLLRLGVSDAESQAPQDMPLCRPRATITVWGFSAQKGMW